MKLPHTVSQSQGSGHQQVGMLITGRLKVIIVPTGSRAMFTGPAGDSFMEGALFIRLQAKA